jgi:hypothetical protein
MARVRWATLVVDTVAGKEKPPVDCVADYVRPAIPQATERQHIGNQIDAAMILTRADFVNVL